MTKKASLIYRGEHFRYEEDEELFEGECVWAWKQGDAGAQPLHVYPITILPRTIRSAAAGKKARVTRARQLEIAHEVKRLLELQDATCEVRVLEERG